jgi:hypothetical protein
MVVGRQLQRRRQQQLGVVQDALRHADLGQEPHRLGMVAVAQQEGPDPRLRRNDVAVCEQGGAGHDLARQTRQGRDVGGGGLRIGEVAGQPVEPFEHLPGHRQGGIDVHRPQEGVDGLRRIPLGDEAEAAFLMQQTELRMRVREARQARQRLVEA